MGSRVGDAEEVHAAERGAILSKKKTGSLGELSPRGLFTTYPVGKVVRFVGPSRSPCVPCPAQDELRLVRLNLAVGLERVSADVRE